MQIWLDSTNIHTIQKARQYGLLSGITTNPTLIANEKRDLEEILNDLLHYQEGPVAVQIVANETDEMVQQGQNLYSLSNRLIIKVPVTANGIQALHLLSRQGIPTMATVIFKAHQALLASLAGAQYIAPYLGAIETEGNNPWTLLHSLTMQTHWTKVKIMAASITSIEQIVRCAESGIFAVTIKDHLFNQLIESDPQTIDRVEKFALDWEKIKTPLFAN